jgi:hypothetical protein
MFSDFTKLRHSRITRVWRLRVFKQRRARRKTRNSRRRTLYHPFKLPIHYIDKSTVFDLSPVVSSDLELVLDVETQKRLMK